MAYKLCKGLIAAGRTAGLREKIEVYHDAKKLTDAEYNELLAMLG